MTSIQVFSQSAFLGLALVLGFTATAQAQQMAETMSCEQLIRYYESNRVAYKTVNGKALPIRGGIPINDFSALTCGPRNYTVVRNTARTTDNPRCVFSAYCHGKDNINQ